MTADEGIGSESPFDGPGFGGTGFDTGSPAGTTTVRPRALPRARPLDETEREQPVPWHVVLLDDDDHTYEYVIRMVQQIFGLSLEDAFHLAQRVDTQGRAVCVTTHKELAELKADQIHGFGPDPLMARCGGPMSAVIEPAECGDGHHDDAGDGTAGS